MEFKGLILDDFQVKSVEALMQNKSVIVSAPTGSGKTLIADYVIEYELGRGKKVVYTAPIKALSNQKYKEFCAYFGERKVGIMTGDVVINAGAPLLIMTTEIYRNMLVVRDPMVADISYVIFDEVHYLNDRERGAVWEESFIFSADHIRFLALSATVPNADELAEWIRTIKKDHPVKVIKYHHRPVPLRHKFFDLDLGLTTIKEIKQLKKSSDFRPRYNRRKIRGGPMKEPTAQHWMIVKELKNKMLLPAIYFVFSRHATQQKAGMLAKKNEFLTQKEKAEVAHQVSQYFSRIDPQINQLNTTQLLKQCMQKGVAFHHAGLLPNLKEIVEILFGQGLIKVLYATETFAVGINMPAKTVCFDSLEKYDGYSFRYLNSKEYFQLAGRAGRRGIDKEGLAVSLINRRTADLNKIADFTSEDKLPITSQFKLSFNSVLNMVGNFDEDQIDILLKSNLGYFQAKGKKGFLDPTSQAKIKRNFLKKKKTLERLGYLKDDQLTQKGQFATHIYSNEIVITEVFYGDFHQKLNEFQILLLASAIIYEGKRGDKFEKGPKIKKVHELIKHLHSNDDIKKRIDEEKVRKLVPIIWNWYNQCQFLDLLNFSNLLEGDLIRHFRQIIDTISQIRKASIDNQLVKKLDNCIQMIDREFVTVSFDQ